MMAVGIDGATVFDETIDGCEASSNEKLTAQMRNWKGKAQHTGGCPLCIGIPL